ncbi:uncharacterized protein LOC116256269 isoform X1 [Nymphaea colorata]|nr:uncharacterized protein LOC116256269 isoform X1 [Nymphaea colorata]XP_031488444.1 uncharacterized protein LOC116256269 isoform X1 [Nymphaea colorata]XP_031488445.1 uncharacterized protein LOC116256269 isoform X1 [Nymphaea colorata]
MAALSILLCLHLCFICSVSSELGTTSDMKELSVGLELHNETLPLQMGSRYYKLIGLKPLHWYEVKISYPASIPASFSIELKRGNFEQERAFSLRRLLNTEKLIFRSGGHSLENNEDTSEGALVYVQPEGVVAKPHLKDMFNIVCDELLLGIPYKAWWVGILAILCIAFVFVLSSVLPSRLLHKGQKSARLNEILASKVS